MQSNSSNGVDVFVVGDVHGCFHTFKTMLVQHWNPERELLVQTGDLIDRGAHSCEVVKLAREYKNTYAERCVFLKGNHEQECIQYFRGETKFDWFGHCGRETIRNFKVRGVDIRLYLQWMSMLPVFFETPDLMISHAGVSDSAHFPFDEYDLEGPLWFRGKTKRLDKVQVIGHRPTVDRKPRYDAESNTWHIDTGACYGGALSAIRLSSCGNVQEVVSIQTDPRDLRA